MPLTVALVIFELVVMVLSISLHDSAQAWVANRLGDPTARMMGRISMNPVKHFDLFGMAIWPILFIFRSPLVLGWGKPVPMTPRNFRNPSRDEIVATLAGPGVQLLAAIVALLILVNLLLFVFNLIPLPFLDGGKILIHYLPYNAAKTYESLSMWMMIGFFFLGFYVIMIFFAPLMTIFNAMLFTL